MKPNLQIFMPMPIIQTGYTGFDLQLNYNGPVDFIKLAISLIKD